VRTAISDLKNLGVPGVLKSLLKEQSITKLQLVEKGLLLVTFSSRIIKNFERWVSAMRRDFMFDDLEKGMKSL